MLPHDGSVSEMPDIAYEESHLKVLRLLESDPRLSQRDLSRCLGISLGKVNYCMRFLLDGGLIEMRSLRNIDNKIEYEYLLTSKGGVIKANLARKFLEIKKKEYSVLKEEINLLRREADVSSVNHIV